MAKVILSQKDNEKPEGFRIYRINSIPKAFIEIRAHYKGDGSNVPIGGVVDVYVDNSHVKALSKDNFKSYKLAVEYGKRIAKKLSNVKVRKKYENLYLRHYNPPN